MKTQISRVITALTVFGLLAVSGIALAASQEGDDTVLNYGYDEDSQFFMWNVTSLDYLPDMEALEEALQDDQSLSEAQLAALLEACGLQGEDPNAPVEYTYSYDGDTGEITVNTPEGYESECGEWEGGEVTGPAGQVNHGMFMKLFNQVYDGAKKGCVVSQIAKSGLGKGPQAVKADPTAAEDPSDNGSIEDGTITFTTETVDCQHGPKAGGDEDTEQTEGESQGKGGPPQRVLDKFGGEKPGKSKDAPGHNKP